MADQGLSFNREFEMPIYFKEQEIGTRRVDLVEGWFLSSESPTKRKTCTWRGHNRRRTGGGRDHFGARPSKRVQGGGGERGNGGQNHGASPIAPAERRKERGELRRVCWQGVLASFLRRWCVSLVARGKVLGG